MGNGRKLKNDISAVLKRSMFIVSVIAVMSMLVACLGVADLIVAGIDARRFEFGVLRAVGARRGPILRLVLAEAVLVSLAAMVLGTLMGLQAVWAGQKVRRRPPGHRAHRPPARRRHPRRLPSPSSWPSPPPPPPSPPSPARSPANSSPPSAADPETPMRPLALPVILAALLLAGCGAVEVQTPAPPRAAIPPTPAFLETGIDLAPEPDAWAPGDRVVLRVDLVKGTGRTVRYFINRAHRPPLPAMPMMRHSRPHLRRPTLHPPRLPRPRHPPHRARREQAARSSSPTARRPPSS